MLHITTEKILSKLTGARNQALEATDANVQQVDAFATKAGVQTSLAADALFRGDLNRMQNAKPVHAYASLFKLEQYVASKMPKLQGENAFRLRTVKKYVGDAIDARWAQVTSPKSESERYALCHNELLTHGVAADKAVKPAKDLAARATAKLRRAQNLQSDGMRNRSRGDLDTAVANVEEEMLGDMTRQARAMTLKSSRPSR